MTTTLNTEKRSANGEDFVAVSNDKGHGCDVYPNGEVIDWQDGNGLIAHDDATEAEACRAAKNA